MAVCGHGMAPGGQAAVAVFRASDTHDEWTIRAFASCHTSLERRGVEQHDFGWTAVVGRAEELAARPKAIEKFRKALALAKKNATEVWPDERPWLEQEDLDALVKKADDAGAWLDDQEKAQKKLKNHEEPAFRVAELNAKLKPTVVLAARLNAKKKPVVIEANATNATDVNGTDGNATDANATEPEPESEEDAKVTEEMKDEL